MDKLKRSIQERNVADKTSSYTDELHEIDLDPEEILHAAAADLGAKMLPEYVVDIYPPGSPNLNVRYPVVSLG
jgi:hypothetical protein